MTVPLVVCDSSPLIALGQIDQLNLLRQLFAAIVVPPAVVAELSPATTLPPWINVRHLTVGLPPQLLGRTLGPGECETIGLATELRASRVIPDDRPARRAAQALGLPVIGTLGLLLAAKRRRLVAAVGPCIEKLTRAGFRLAPALMGSVLRDAGES